jgi:hypothetical protein
MSILNSQTVAEVTYNALAPVRTSQATLEVSYSGYTPGVSTVRASQTVLEVLCDLQVLPGYVSIVGRTYSGLAG